MDVKTCESCRHWDNDPDAVDKTGPAGVDGVQRHGLCGKVQHLYKLDDATHLPYMMDASGYKADFWAPPGFFCRLHEVAEGTPPIPRATTPPAPDVSLPQPQALDPTGRCDLSRVLAESELGTIACSVGTAKALCEHFGVSFIESQWGPVPVGLLPCGLDTGLVSFLGDPAEAE
jgi:hypothetical protein